MELPSLDFELAPKAGSALAARKAELDSARFVSVRNLAYLVYKKPDGTPLMTYQETLDNRDAVKRNILVHEMNCTFQGQPIVVNDGTSLDAPPPQASSTPQPAAPQVTMSNGNGAPNGVPMMAAVPHPGYAAPAAPATPAQAAAVPMAAPGYAAPPQMMAPGQPVPPAAAPAEAAAAPGQRRRRGAGAAVAPPPPAPPPAQYGTPVGAPPPAAAPGYAPPAGPPAAAPGWAPPGQPNQGFAPPPAAAPAFAAPAGAPAPAFAAPPAAPQAAPAAAYAAPQAAPQAASVDLTPVLQRLDNLGKGVEIAAQNGDQALKAVQALQAQLQATQTIAYQALAALHHMYLTHPQLGPTTNSQANTLPDFQSFLAKYLPK